MLRLLVTMPPGGVRVILPADRGFGRAEPARTCHDLRLRYVIRIRPDVRVAHPGQAPMTEEEFFRERLEGRAKPGSRCC